MAIIIKIKDLDPVERILLKAKKTIDGNIIISDHPEIDILILPAQKKVVTLAKEELDDEVYETQQRFFRFLVTRGVVIYDSVQAGNLFMSLEAKIPDAKEGDKIQYLLYSISEFMEKDLPYYEDKKEFERELEKSLLEPEPDEYTDYETAIKTHRDRKGTLRPQMRPYGISTIYKTLE
jgi:hypothetical protein